MFIKKKKKNPFLTFPHGHSSSRVLFIVIRCIHTYMTDNGESFNARQTFTRRRRALFPSFFVVVHVVFHILSKVIGKQYRHSSSFRTPYERITFISFFARSFFFFATMHRRSRRARKRPENNMYYIIRDVTQSVLQNIIRTAATRSDERCCTLSIH